MLCKTEQNSKVLFGWQSPALWSKKTCSKILRQASVMLGTSASKSFREISRLFSSKCCKHLDSSLSWSNMPSTPQLLPPGRRRNPSYASGSKLEAKAARAVSHEKAQPQQTQNANQQNFLVKGGQLAVADKQSTMKLIVESYSKKVWQANLQFWKTKITKNRGSFHCGFRGSLKRVHSQKMMKKKHLKHSSFAVEKNQNALSGHPQFLHVNLEGKIVRRMRSLLTRHRAVWLSGRSSTQNFSNSTSHAVNIHAVKIMLLDFLHDFHCDMRLYRPLRFDSPSAAHALLCGKSRWLHCSAKSLSW